MTYLFLPWLIRSLHGTPAMGKDLNKAGRPLVPEMGGLGVILGFYVGVSVFIALAADSFSGAALYAALTAVLGAGVVGLIDDMFGLRQRYKALLPFILALPLGAVTYSAGDVTLLGLNLGVLTIVVIPLGVTSAANAANMLEGFNGLGAGMGVIMALAIIGLGFVRGQDIGWVLAFPLLGALLAFLAFNKFPARVFPGDSMTLFMGAAIAAAAIVAQEKTLGALLFIPMIAEFGLKLRGRFQGENYGNPNPDGRLVYEGPTESLTHVLMKWKSLKEWQVVGTLWGVEAVVAIVVVAAAGR